MRNFGSLALGLGLGLTVASALGGCVVGAPPAFSPGVSWTLPLVDPLNDGRLVVPVRVNGQGPFLFAIDPDAQVTTIDREIAAVATTSMHQGPRLVNQHDTTVPTFYATIANVQIGDLTLGLLPVAGVEDHEFDADGRRIFGILGRDVIADSLVFTVDRDRGVATLTVHDHFTEPANAQVVKYTKLENRGGLGSPRGYLAHTTTRYLVDANVNGSTFALHLDLGHSPSQLRPEDWADAKLSSTPAQASIIDETGDHNDITADGIALAVSVPTMQGAAIHATDIGFAPFVDRRWLKGDFEGTLGWNFLRPYVVSADWHRSKLYLTPRAPSATAVAARFSRWGSNPASCAVAGCATVSVATAGDATTALGMAAPAAARATTPRLHLQRDPALAGAAVEYVIAATAADGHALGRLYVELDARTSAIDAELGRRFAGAQLAVVDLSPFTRACPSGEASCVELPAAIGP